MSTYHLSITEIGTVGIVILGRQLKGLGPIVISYKWLPNKDRSMTLLPEPVKVTSLGKSVFANVI